MIGFDNLLKQAVNRCMLDNQKTGISTASFFFVRIFQILFFKYDLSNHNFILRFKSLGSKLKSTFLFV